MTQKTFRTTRLVVTPNSNYALGYAILGEVVRETAEFVTYRTPGPNGEIVKRSKYGNNIEIVDGETSEPLTMDTAKPTPARPSRATKPFDILAMRRYNRSLR